jgi:Kae1-associated kinase Bud32
MLLGKGAEATVTLEDGVVVKRRLPKAYRHPQLDGRIRSERTKREARLMRRASRGAKVPRVLGEGEFELRMEFVEGELLRERGAEGLGEEIGRAVGALHSMGVAHNDLTTSNMVLHGGEVWLVDFGLADRGGVEDFATDLKVLFEAGEVPRGEFWKGYAGKMPGSDTVRRRLERVYARGRYVSKSP